MTRQITLLGGQILPVYLGILEKKPDEVHVLYTKETRQLLPRLIHEFPQVKIHSYQVDPYDFIGIKEFVTNIILDNEKDEFQLNLTSGTKVMALACQSVVSALDFKVFYIDQKHRLFCMSDESFSNLKSSIKIKTFFALSGHKNYTSWSLSNFTNAEIDFAYDIFEQSQQKSGLYTLFDLVRTNCDRIPTTKQFAIKDANTSVNWKNSTLQINLLNKQLICTSKIAFQIAFGGLWWELVVADVTHKWSKSTEHIIGVEIQTKSSHQSKNEIDIVLNTGKHLIFIECKSGNVTQADINKIRTVNRLYGGISSKSILVCRYIPRKDLLEKCKDLGIEVFAFQNQFTNSKNSSNITLFNDMSDLLKKLDLLTNRIEIS